MTAEDVKFTIEQNLKPDSPGGSAPFFRINLDRIEIPDKYTIVLHFKNRLWEVPAQVSQFVGYQNITSKKYMETVGEEKAALHPIGTGSVPPRRGPAGRLPPLRGGAQALAADAGVQGAGGAPDSRRRGAAVRSAHG